jgi:Protein of unknown function (DUF2892)
VTTINVCSDARHGDPLSILRLLWYQNDFSTQFKNSQIMKIEYNLSFSEIIGRHLLGMFLGIIGGFLGYYVASVFFILIAFSPIMILTAILGWSPLYSLLKINHASH